MCRAVLCAALQLLFIRYISSQSGQEAIYYCAIAFVALPFAVNLSILVSVVVKELKQHEPFNRYFNERKNLVLLVLFLASTNLECFGILHSGW